MGISKILTWSVMFMALGSRLGAATADSTADVATATDLEPKAEAQTIAGTSIEMFNTKVVNDPEGLKNLRELVKLEARLHKTLQQVTQGKTRLSAVQVKRETQAIVGPLQDYFKRLWPGRMVTIDMLKKSMIAHDPSGTMLANSILLQFLNQPDQASMMSFFQKTISDHDKFVQVCKEFVTIANDVKKSISPKTKTHYHKKLVKKS